MTTTADPNAQFRAKFLELVGRPITEEELYSNQFLEALSNDLFVLLELERQATFSGERLSQLDNPSLKKLIEAHPNVLNGLSADRIAGRGQWEGSGFGAGDIQKFAEITDNVSLRADLENVVAEAAKSGGEGGGKSGDAPAEGVPGGPGGAKPPVSARPEDVTSIPPTTHGWVQEIGAQDWYRQKIAEGLQPAQITVELLREDTRRIWESRKTDPKYADIISYAEQYYASTGWWPTEVEFNRYTQNAKDVPNLNSKGDLIPKPSAKSKEGEHKKWELPKDPLPPGYEWRFAADGTPVPFDISPEYKDVMAGWFQDPKTGQWTYDPIAGAADYLTYNKESQSDWGHILNAFISRTGRLPSLEEARNLASQLWSKAGLDSRDRATRFADIHGYWPTPYELEFGPSQSQDANTGGGGQNAAGMGQVPVHVPGIGTVLVQGESLGTGGFLFDPFQGIPGSVRPWVKEILNGRLTVDQLPAEMRAWAGYALSKFQEQLPQKRPEEIPWGVPGPSGIAPLPIPQIDAEAGKAQFLTAWKQINPSLPDPTADQLNDIAWLSQQDIGALKFLGGETLKQLPISALVQFDNQTLTTKLGMDIIAQLPNERLIGLTPYDKAGFDVDTLSKLPDDRLLSLPIDIIAKLSDERLKTLPPDKLDPIVTDPARRQILGLPVDGIAPATSTKPAETAGDTTTAAPVTVKPLPAPPTTGIPKTPGGKVGVGTAPSMEAYNKTKWGVDHPDHPFNNPLSPGNIDMTEESPEANARRRYHREVTRPRVMAERAAGEARRRLLTPEQVAEEARLEEIRRERDESQ